MTISSQLQTEEDEQDLLESELKSKDNTKNIIDMQKVSPYYGFGAFGVKGTEIALFAKHPLKANKAKNLADKVLKNTQYRYRIQV